MTIPRGADPADYDAQGRFIGAQPDFSGWLKPSVYDRTGLVMSICHHGAPTRSVAVVHASTMTLVLEEGQPKRDGDLYVVRPRVGASWVRAKHMTAAMDCVNCHGGQVSPEDLSRPANEEA